MELEDCKKKQNIELKLTGCKYIKENRIKIERLFKKNSQKKGLELKGCKYIKENRFKSERL